MIYTGKGIVRDLRSGTSKKGNAYNLLELGGEDYAKHTVFVPEDKVPAVKTIPLGSWVLVQISVEDTGSGSRTALAAIQKCQDK